MTLSMTLYLITIISIIINITLSSCHGLEEESVISFGRSLTGPRVRIQASCKKCPRGLRLSGASHASALSRCPNEGFSSRRGMLLSLIHI